MQTWYNIDGLEDSDSLIRNGFIYGGDEVRIGTGIVSTVTFCLQKLIKLVMHGFQY